MLKDVQPEMFYNDIFLARKRFVENSARGNFNPMQLLEMSGRLSAMLATSGPAGINVSPFMISFLPKKEKIAEINHKIKEYMSAPGPKNMQMGTQFILDVLYDESILEPMTFVTHLMNKGHTYENVLDNGNMALGFIIPPDKGAYEVRAKGRIEEAGEYYDFANLAHDVIHVKPHEKPFHDWCPALIIEVTEIYDNSYKSLGKKIYPC